MTQLIVYERHESITDEQTSLLWKTLVAQFINTAFIYYVGSFIFRIPIWAPQGIIFNLSMMLFVLSLGQLVFKIINMKYWCWKLCTWLNFRRGPL